MSQAEVKFIPCKSIDGPKVPGEVRSFSREFAVKLAESIKVDGLLIPIAVRPNPEAPGRYLLVNGKHRLFASKNVLKQELIAARIFEDMDEAEAAIVRDVENLWRNPLTPAQHAAALKRWHDNWVSTLPPIPDKTEAAQSASASEISQSEESRPSAVPPFDPTPTIRPGSRKPEEYKEATFDQRVADATGQSVGSVGRTKRIAKTFSQEELEVFAQCEVTQADMLWIAKIKDSAKRSQVVSLVASGLTAAVAIQEILGAEAPTRPNETEDTKVTKEARGEAQKLAEPELSDEDWFEKYCGEKAKMLANPHKFKADAILFRKIAEPRHVFRSKCKTTLKEIKKCGVSGSFWNLVNRVVAISHPKDWNLCPECKGTGIKEGAPVDQTVKPNCPKCYGAAYLLKTEEYL